MSRPKSLARKSTTLLRPMSLILTRKAGRTAGRKLLDVWSGVLPFLQLSQIRPQTAPWHDRVRPRDKRPGTLLFGECLGDFQLLLHLGGGEQDVGDMSSRTRGEPVFNLTDLSALDSCPHNPPRFPAGTGVRSASFFWRWVEAGPGSLPDRRLDDPFEQQCFDECF